MIFTKAPTKEEINRLDPVYLSYFLPWNSVANYEFAKHRGFKDLTHEWERTHCAENFDQVDSRAYLVHPWLKYPKFGHASATDYTARFIRYGLMSRDEAINIVKEKDHNLDVKSVEDFCEFCNYTITQFWSVVEGLYNRELFKKDEFGRWVLKNPIS